MFVMFVMFVWFVKFVKFVGVLQGRLLGAFGRFFVLGVGVGFADKNT